MRKILHYILFFISGIFIFLDKISECFKYEIKKNDVVLDVGGGNRPFLRSNIVLDKFLEDDTERPSTGRLKQSKYHPLVIGDCLNLPFKNKSIDFVYSCNLVEHIEDIDTFLSELQRVAKRGVLVGPSFLSELFAGQHFHHWLIFKEENTLIFKKKPDSIYSRHMLSLVIDLFKNKNASMLILFNLFYGNFFKVVYKWEGKINYKVCSHSATEEISECHFPENRDSICKFGLGEKIKNRIYDFTSALLLKK